MPHNRTPAERPYIIVLRLSIEHLMQDGRERTARQIYTDTNTLENMSCVQVQVKKMVMNRTLEQIKRLPININTVYVWRE